MKNTLHENLLLEYPHVELELDDGDVTYWDFCSEDGMKNGKWINQLKDLYKYKHMHTLNSIKNQNEFIKFDDDDLESITNSLIGDLFFINIVKHDLPSMKEEDIEELKNILPNKLKKAIKLQG